MTIVIDMPACFRAGDARQEIEAAIQHCATEHGGTLIGEPTVQVIREAQEDGDSVVKWTCVILEDGDPTGWWCNYLSVHGWNVPRWAGIRS